LGLKQTKQWSYQKQENQEKDMTGKFNFQLKPGTWLTVLLGSVLLSLLLSACGAEEPKVYRVGILSGLSVIADITDGFKAEMAELGYVEGENIVYDVQETDFDINAYQRVLQKFVADEVDLIFVFPTEAALEAKTATQGTDIPVLFNYALTEGAGLVESVREPGGNITGVRYPGPDIAIRRFEIMLELVPEAKRMWLPYQRGYPIVTSQLEVLRPVAEAMGVTLIETPADNGAELEAELQSLAESGDISLDAVLFLVDPLSARPDVAAVMSKLVTEQRIPIGGDLTQIGEDQTIFGLNPDTFNSGKQAAPLADKILKGTPAGTIPVVSAEGYLKINYKGAQKLGLTVSEGLLSQAAEIIR
jgi:putative ABC transport system substrate-binding protein